MSMCAAMKRTRAPASRAARARAAPCLPDERLPRKRTGSRGSRVPPAVMVTVLPLSGPGADSGSAGRRFTAAMAAAKMSSGSGRRPAPESLPVRRPMPGSITRVPRLRKVWTLARVAGCAHISVCMAGAKRTGPRAMSRVLVSRSLACPEAARASRSAVAGATTMRSASCPSRTWLTFSTSSKTELETGLPDNASQVATPTNRVEASVGITETLCPASVKRRSSDADL